MDIVTSKSIRNPVISQHHLFIAFLLDRGEQGATGKDMEQYAASKGVNPGHVKRFLEERSDAYHRIPRRGTSPVRFFHPEAWDKMQKEMQPKEIAAALKNFDKILIDFLKEKGETGTSYQEMVELVQTHGKGRGIVTAFLSNRSDTYHKIARIKGGVSRYFHVDVWDEIRERDRGNVA